MVKATVMLILNPPLPHLGSRWRAAQPGALDKLPHSVGVDAPALGELANGQADALDSGYGMIFIRGIDSPEHLLRLLFFSVDRTSFDLS